MFEVLYKNNDWNFSDNLFMQTGSCYNGRLQRGKRN